MLQLALDSVNCLTFVAHCLKVVSIYFVLIITAQVEIMWENNIWWNFLVSRKLVMLEINKPQNFMIIVLLVSFDAMISRGTIVRHESQIKAFLIHVVKAGKLFQLC